MAQSTIEHPVGGPRQPQQRRRRQRVRSSVESMVTLAKWQLGSTWKLLLLAEVGILAAAVLICLIPLYSSVALSAGLRDALMSNVQNAFMAVGATQVLNTSSGLNMTGTGLIYLVQNVPTPQVIIPLVPILAVIALVAPVTILSLVIIVRIVTRPALSEILRLNED